MLWGLELYNIFSDVFVFLNLIYLIMNVQKFYVTARNIVTEVTGVGERPMIFCNRTECVDARAILIAILLEKGMTESEIALNMGVTPQCVNKLKNGFHIRKNRWSVLTNWQEVRKQFNEITTNK